MSPIPDATSRRAFTLVELLAAITVVGLLSTIGVARVQAATERARTARAVADLRVLLGDLVTRDTLPATLAEIGRDGLRDPWGNPYEYVPFPLDRRTGLPRRPPQARKDRFLVPINSRFDLYSRGPDGRTTAPLTSRFGRDDIIIANDGAYIGPAWGY